MSLSGSDTHTFAHLPSSEATTTLFNPLASEPARSTLLQPLPLPNYLKASDLCFGADPHIFFDPQCGNYVLVLRGLKEEWISGDSAAVLLRIAPTVMELKDSPVVEVGIYGGHPSHYKQVWAPEIHYINDSYYLYATMSDGDNLNHRMCVYQSDSLRGPYHYVGIISDCTDCWAIDMTYIPEINCFVWSGWKNKYDEFPQRIYIAKSAGPTQLGSDRVEIACPDEEVCQLARLFEGAQALVVDGEFLGLTIAADASWSVLYSTFIIWYRGGDPLHADSWIVDTEPLVPSGYSLGHGTVITDKNNDLLYVTHRKRDASMGWDNRSITAIPIEKEYLYMRMILALRRQRENDLQLETSVLFN